MDSSIISAPSSTKNESGQLDPEMHQTKKGNQWHLSMKMHTGAYDRLGLIHRIDTTAAIVHDIVPAGNLLYGEEKRVLGDVGYLGIHKQAEHKHRKDFTWFIAKRPGTGKKLDADKLKAEKIKASISAKVKHPFRYIKQVFGYSKVRSLDLAKMGRKRTNRGDDHAQAAFEWLFFDLKSHSAKVGR